MKKILVFLMVIMMLTLVGCGNTTEESSQATGMATTKMDEITELMAGTMLLETTAYPLDVGQESSLLLLWKGYSAVVTSSTSADEEINALEEQIKAVFTKNQLSAIDELELSNDTLSTELSDAGINLIETAVIVADASTTTDIQMPSGGGEMPSGGGDGQMPSGGGDMMSGNTGTTGISDLTQTSTQTTNSISVSTRTVNTVILNTVLQYLNNIVNI